jgi:O-acetyl-ADP-ribose deacetylase (regulator of RNase III)
VPITFYSGDLFADDSIRARAHGCNCAGAMGAGIAVAFKKRWPAMYEEYRLRCEQGRFQPGDVFVWEDANDVVYNLGTQAHWRADATLPAIETSVRWMLDDAAQRGLEAVAIPQVGAGLGGLDWPDVRALFVQLGEASKVELSVVEQFAPGQALTRL